MTQTNCPRYNKVVLNKSTLSNEEVLKRAIEKAKDNGLSTDMVDDVLGNPLRDLIITNMLEENLYYSFIFRHDFAKAFWGEELVCEYDGSKILGKGKLKQCEMNQHWSWQQDFIESWQYRLQQMVLESEPLRYIERYL